MKKVFPLLLFLFFISFLHAQSGVPYIINFTKNDYLAAGQNWDVTTDSIGRIYFGNTKGLLQYNGSYWKLYPLPKGKYVRSVLKTSKGRIYVGSFEEFGYFDRDVYGKLIYHSLADSVKNYTFQNNEIWDIVSHQNKIYFRSFSSHFIYDGKTVSVVEHPFITLFLKELNGSLYTFRQNIGLGYLKNDKFHLLVPQSQLNNDGAISVLPYKKDKLLIISSKNGLFHYDGKECKPWKGEANELLKGETINKAIITKDSLYIIGTITNGLYAIDQSGKLKWRINASNGLLDNTVLGLGCDADNNIWATLENGLSYIKSNSQNRFIKPFEKNIGSICSAIYHKEYLYMASNQGLFFYPKNNERFEAKLMSGMSEQALCLSLIDNQLICGHNTGTYEIVGEKAIKLSSINGATCIQKAFIHQQEVLVQSTYTYLNIYKRDQAGRWQFSHSVSDFMQPIQHFEVDAQGDIWASHFHKGIFRIRLNPDLTKPEKVEYHPSLLKNTHFQGVIPLFKIKGRVVFNDQQLYYTYDDLSNQIVPYEQLNKLPHLKNIRKAVPIDNDTYWCINDKEFIKIHSINDQISIKRQIPFSYFHLDLPDHNENIIPLGSNKNMICLNNGVAIIDENDSPYSQEKRRIVRIESVESFFGDERFPLEIEPKKKPVIGFRNNNITFGIAHNFLDKKDEVRFAYKLEGLDSHFSISNKISRKEYNRLDWGHYAFQVIALDNTGNQLASVSYHFEIAPPFYASRIAWLIYLFLSLALLATARWAIRQYISRSKERLLVQQQKQIKEEQERQEQVITKLKNQNLESELSFKSKELASSTMMLINKNEVLVEMREELIEQKEKLGTQFPNKYHNRLIQLIDSHLSSEDDWLIFQTNFDRIHENFFRNLKSKYPDLTPNDLKICALLRLNLSTKDIANLLGITIRGVEIARYRLRKKLEIPSEKNLIEFMIEFK